MNPNTISTTNEKERNRLSFMRVSESGNASRLHTHTHTQVGSESKWTDRDRGVCCDCKWSMTEEVSVAAINCLCENAAGDGGWREDVRRRT